MKTFPVASRTIDPTNKAYTTIIGRHDQKLSDADINLIQDLQDYKDARRLQNITFSGMLGSPSFLTLPGKGSQFIIPKFDVLFNNEVVTIGGSNFASLSTNLVILPPPSPSASSTSNIYVLYLEMWYQELDPSIWSGYAAPNSMYPNGGIQCPQDLWVPDDTVDILNSLTTTYRSQIQWAIRYAQVPISYDFNQSSTGLDPQASYGLYAQAALSNPLDSTAPNASSYIFSNLGPVTGDFGLWAAGQSQNSSLPTLDGMSYAFPLALISRRNTDNYDPSSNPLGGVNRYDQKVADAIYDSDLVDTRRSVSLSGYNLEEGLRNGFTSLVTGGTRLKVGRGDGVGNSSSALGSRMDYTVSVSSSQNYTYANSIGGFNGYINGFGLDNRVFYTNKTVSVTMKQSNLNSPWAKGDTFSLQCPVGYTFTYAQVQSITTQSLTPLLLNGLLSIEGFNTPGGSLIVTFNEDPSPSYYPGTSDLQVLVGIQAVNTQMSLAKVPYSVNYGSLNDKASQFPNMQVYGVSDYQYQNTLGNFTVIHPRYSNNNFGVQYSLQVAPSSPGVITINASSLPTGVLLSHAVSVSASGTPIPITSQTFTNWNTLTINFTPPAISSPMFNVTLQTYGTAQMSYNAPVKGITTIAETVMFGIGSTGSSNNDKRIKYIGALPNGSNSSTLIFSTTDSLLIGISGNYCFSVVNGVATPSALSSTTVFNNGYVAITVPISISAISSSAIYFIGNLTPALSSDSSLMTTFEYIPYQGEGKSQATYSVVSAEDFALVTTNGTGAAPVIGLQDVFPYNRELPLSSVLPSLPSWDDSQLKNQSYATQFDNNYETKQFNNVDHTFMVPLKTNDYIQPVSGSGGAKNIAFGPKGTRGFGSTYPNVGFAISAPKPKATVGVSVFSTTNPITLYVNNAIGDDSFSGFSTAEPKRTIQSALASLPSVLNHPCNILLMVTNIPFKLTDAPLVSAMINDGATPQVAIGNLAFVTQGEGRLYIGRDVNVTSRIQIDATNSSLDQAMAFVISNTTVIFSGIQFSGFSNEAVYAVNSNLLFDDCEWDNNTLSASFSSNCNVVMQGGIVNLGTNGQTGFIVSGGSLSTSGMSLQAPVTGINAFYICERNSNLTFTNHTTAEEIGVSASTAVVVAKLGSSVVCDGTSSSNGKALLSSNSIMTYASQVSPFLGYASTDYDATSSAIQAPLT